jgi:cell division protein FtsQ
VSRVQQSVLSLPRRRPPAFLRLVPSARALVAATAFVLAAVGMWAIARGTSMFAIRAIDVEGASPAITRQAVAAIWSFDGTSLLQLNGAALVRRLEDLPAVRTATYDRDFPHTLRVRIVPEQPAAVLRQGPSSWLVSASGRVIGPVVRGRFPALPRIWLPATAQVALGSVLADADGGAAARALAQVGGAGRQLRVSWGRVEAGQLTLGLRSGLELRFGSPTDVALKIAIVKAIVPTLTRPSAGGPTYLDVSVVERPVAGRNTQPSG